MSDRPVLRRRAWRVIPVTVLGRTRLSVAVGMVVVAMGTAALAAPRVPTSPTPASTRLQHSRVLSYPADQVWPTALRYLRVDREFELVDRDQEAGYILFDFPVGTDRDGPKGRGSLELISTVDPAGRPAVKLSVSTDAGPSHLPHAIADGLAAKLRAERGQPPPPPRPEPPAPTPKPPEDDGPWAPLPPEDGDP
ncbi:MAG: hypothetical protein KC501_14210 [Myxococcales bacterium]|nr:hypothetical protein [Myxococcales bacterium]